MSLLLLTAAKGAPGVTTTAVALATNWPHPVLLVEADPAGPSAVLPGFLRGQVRHAHGIIDAAVAARTGTLPAELPGMLVDLTPTAGLLPGLARPEQAATMARSWEQLATALAELARTTDVIVDAGRLGSLGAPTPLLGVADRVLLTTRTDLPALHATRSWIPAVTAGMVDPARLGLLLVGEGQPYLPGEITKHLGLPVIATLAWDPTGARQWSAGAPAPKRPSELGRSLPRALTALAPPTHQTAQPEQTEQPRPALPVAG